MFDAPWVLVEQAHPVFEPINPTSIRDVSNNPPIDMKHTTPIIQHIFLYICRCSWPVWLSSSSTSPHLQSLLTGDWFRLFCWFVGTVNKSVDVVGCWDAWPLSSSRIHSKVSLVWESSIKALDNTVDRLAIWIPCRSLGSLEPRFLLLIGVNTIGSMRPPNWFSWREDRLMSADYCEHEKTSPLIFLLLRKYPNVVKNPLRSRWRTWWMNYSGNHEWNVVKHVRFVYKYPEIRQTHVIVETRQELQG